MTGVGLGLVVLALGFVAWHLPAVWRKEPQAGHLHGYLLRWRWASSWPSVGCSSSVRRAIAGNPVAYWSHVAAAVLVPLFYLAHRRLSLWKPAARTYRVVPAAVVGVVGAGRGATRTDL